MKRYIFCFAVFTAVFFLNCKPTFASNNNVDASGYNTWSTPDKIVFWGTNGLQLLDAFSGVFTGSSAEEIDELYLRYTQAYGGNYSSYGEMLAEGTRWDEDTETFTFSDDTMSFINFVKSDRENSITYVYGYLPGTGDLDPDGFRTANAYYLINNFIVGHPTKAFYISGGSFGYPDEDGNTYLRSGWMVHCIDYPYGGVSSSLSDADLKFGPATFYTEDWSNKFNSTIFYVFDVDDTYNYMFYKDADGNYQTVSDPTDANDFDLSLISETKSEEMLSFVGGSFRAWNSEKPVAYRIFSDATGGIPIFKSAADLKRGTSAGVQGQFMPGYTPGEVTDNSITQTEINDYSTNYNYYYGSGGSGSGGSSGDSGSSGGGFFDSFLNALGSLGDAVLGILSKLIEFIAKAVSFITDAFSDIASLAENGFTDLLTAFFPFLPSEWVAAITLLLALAVFGVVINLFGK